MYLGFIILLLLVFKTKKVVNSCLYLLGIITNIRLIFFEELFLSNIDKNFQETSVWEYLLDKLKTPSAEGFLI